jgi:hypothetical protein
MIQYTGSRPHLAEHNVLAVQPGGGDGGDEELGALRVGAGVGHGQVARGSVLQLEVLVWGWGKVGSGQGVRGGGLVQRRESGNDWVQRKHTNAKANAKANPVTHAIAYH